MNRVPPAVGIVFVVIVGYVLWGSYARGVVGDAAGSDLVKAIVGLLLLYLVATNADKASGLFAALPATLESLFRPAAAPAWSTPHL